MSARAWLTGTVERRRGALGAEDRPVVSVIIPARDAAAHLGDALACLVDQFGDPRAIEPIVVDDGSRDATVEIARSFTAALPRMQVLTTAVGSGVSAARNRGTARATGRYLTYLDADDWFGRGRLPVLVEALEELECDFVRTDLIWVTGTHRQVAHAPHFPRGVREPGEAGIGPADGNSMVDHPSMFTGLYHRRLAEAGLLNFVESLPSAEDRELTWRLHLSAASFAVVDAPGAFYRRAVANSLTQARDARRLGYLAAFERVRQRSLSSRFARRALPKAAQTVLALTAQHLQRSRTARERGELIGGTRALLSRFPGEVLRGAEQRLDRSRAEELAGLRLHTLAGQQ